MNIAIVGRAGVFPQSVDLTAFWQNIVHCRDMTSEVPDDRWRLDPNRVLNHSVEGTWSNRGGYVPEMDLVPSDAWMLDDSDIAGLDPLQSWVLHTAQGAINDGARLPRERTGLILGNLSFPSSAMSAYVERQWFPNVSNQQTHPNHRFMSGRPALLAKKAFALGGPAWALDCACASGLVSIHLGCEALMSGQMDAVLAGAVNRADDLFIHMGFTALKALSRSGRSQPFSADADGLLPAEGAGFVLLKRLEDAQRDGDPIFGVIRGTGVSNDGRGKGLLVPASRGQVQAMSMAYKRAAVSPETIQMVECHATGTVLGDGTELRSMTEVFNDAQTPWVGSLKGNMGHAITAAGIGGMLKVLESFRHDVIPAHRPVDTLNETLLEGRFRLLQSNQDWQSGRPKRAGVSAFGFGGNNAHIVVEAWADGAFVPAVRTEMPSEPIVITAVDASVGTQMGLTSVVNAFAQSDWTSLTSPVTEIVLDGAWMKFPPRDLQQSLPQQNTLMALAQSLEQQTSWDSARTGVWVGMGTDVHVCRYGARWRVDEWIPTASSELKDAMITRLESAGVLGCMPNIPANRLNSQLDCQGASGTVSAEEGSGHMALELAIQALQRGEMDTAIVGAIDRATDSVHQQAKVTGIQGLDGAAMLVLKRASDVLETDTVYGHISFDRSNDPFFSMMGHIGDAHVAQGLLDVALSLCTPDPKQVALQDMMGNIYSVRVEPSSTIQLPAPVDMKRSMVMSYPVFEPPRLGESAPRAPVLPSVHAPIPLWQPVRTEPDVPVQPVTQSVDPVQPFTQEFLESEMPNINQMWWNEWTALQQQHNQFLHHQATLHQSFLNLNGQMQQLLLQAASGTVSMQTQEITGVPASTTVEPPVVHPPVVPSVPSVQTPTPQPTAVAPKPTPVEIAEPESIKPTVSIVAPTAEQQSVPDLLKHDVYPEARAPIGDTLDRDGLKVHASGNISEIFGSTFVPQDQYAVQTRMPEPPLLLADRMTGLDAEAGSMTTGTIWTETDVTAEDWFVFNGRMPAGVMIESGQADLMLISYLGIDLLTKGERSYRLLGCELMYHDDLPAIGETLCYDIHVDGHAKHGDVRLFFFHYDCRINGKPRLTVRQGQAGFFTEEELADSDGILWTPEEQEIVENPVLDPPTYEMTATTYTAEQVRAFSEGRPWECFSGGMLRTHTHTRTPSIQSGQMLFLRSDVLVDPKGGPWGRGYLKTTVQISPDDWYFEGHFKNDPCMPGTLMFEGCLQAMAFYLASMGYTADRDGWRFQPVPKRPYPLLCRGQVLPSSKELTYEIFVEECSNGDKPYLIADLLCTVDGLGAFHARAMGLELVPDYPLTTMRHDTPEILDTLVDESICEIATDKNGFRFDYEAMVASALGQPSKAFGQMYEVFDGPRTVARLPGFPYHFMSRVKSVDGNLGTREVGTKIVLDYDIPNDAWYFDENGAKVMPFCVLLEAALQPCGWLASAVGSAIPEKEDLSFRNLDGTGTLHRDIAPLTESELQTFETTVTITGISKSAGMIIESFDVQCTIGDDIIYDLQTVFGFFPDAALRNQVGLPLNDVERKNFSRESKVFVDLTTQPDKYCGGSLRLANPMLCMLDRITGFDPRGGAKGLGWLRGEKSVDPAEWFFKAHFFQDPVQPGSLGIEAMIQLLQWYMIEQGMGQNFNAPRFTCLGLKREMQWRYRGQVVPENQVITTTMDIVEVGEDEIGEYAVAKASLWVDGKRIYEAENLCVHIVEST